MCCWSSRLFSPGVTSAAVPWVRSGITLSNQECLWACTFQPWLWLWRVILRTAALPVHGWLIQVMEAPTPVSALLHAGVVNLGVAMYWSALPRFWIRQSGERVLLAFGLDDSRIGGNGYAHWISIKVRLAWSTVAQMGFMLLECALGLYTLAALHLIGHSLYKAHTFLAASTVVNQTRLQGMYTGAVPQYRASY